MSNQLELNFESPEKKAEKEKIIFSKEFETENFYVYNKYLDFILDHIPFRLGWKIVDFPLEVKWWIKCKYQKFKYGACDDDVFSLYYNIAKFSCIKLKYFKEKGKKGIPCTLLPENYHTLSEKEREYIETKTEEQWNNILDEIIFAFEFILDPDKFCEFPKVLEKRMTDLNLNSEKSNDEKIAWENYLSQCKILNERKEKGLKLFAEHFESLWI